MTENGAYVIYATDVLLNPRPAPVAASEPPEGPGAVQDDIVKWDVGGVACRTRCEGLVSCHEDVQVDRQPGPNLVDADALFCLWAGLDRCFACRDEVFAAREAPTPGRPFLAPRDLNTLFIGEAPPTDGGFWRLRNGDELRGRLLPVLPAWPDHVDCDSMEAVEWFVGARYFFVQAMKWPLKDSYSTQTWASQCALDHAVCSHLEDEIECINFVLAGYLLHRTAGAGQGIRAEIDALAVRFPHQREPLHTSPYPAQPNDPRLILPDDVRLVDFVVAEVKAGTSPPRFNAPLTNRGRGADRNVEDVLSMLGCFAEEAEIKTAAQAILSQLARPSREAPATYDLKSGVARVRFLLFWEPGTRRRVDRFFIPLSHVVKIVAERTHPGAACEPYSRPHAGWRGFPELILSAMDTASRERRSHESVAALCADIRQLGQGDEPLRSRAPRG